MATIAGTKRGLKALARQDWENRIDRLATIPEGKRALVYEITSSDMIVDGNRQVPVNQVGIRARRKSYKVRRDNKVTPNRLYIMR